MEIRITITTDVFVCFDISKNRRNKRYLKKIFVKTMTILLEWVKKFTLRDFTIRDDLNLKRRSLN